MRSYIERVRARFSQVIRDQEDMHDYQDTAVEFLDANPFSALFIDLGLGKTIISLTLIARLVHRMLDAGEDGPILVVAPLKVATQTWPNEIPLWQHTAGLTWHVIRAEGEEYEAEIKAAGRAAVEARRAFYADMPDRGIWLEGERHVAQMKQKAAILERLARSRACIHIINREALVWLVKLFGRKWPFKTVIIDESSNFKDHKTNRFRAMRYARKYITRLHLLTATPAPESYLDLFSQIFLLDRGERLGNSITRYREEYFTHNRYTHKWKIRKGAAEEITKLIADLCLVMKAEDYLDLKAPVFVPRRLKMTRSQRRQYDTLQRDFVMEVTSDAFVEAANAADLRQKLLQLCSGAVYERKMVEDEKGEFRRVNLTHHVHDLKVEDLECLLEELQGKPVLVSYWFKSSLDRLKKAFPFAKVMDREGKLVKDWNAGKVRMCLIHPMSGAHGLNMQHGGHHLYLFDLFDSNELFLQLVGRLARQGQKELVQVHMPQMIDTGEEDVVAGVMQKKDLQEAFFKRLKRLRKQYEEVTSVEAL